jgi:adenosylcobinamide-GDP ribazoletransferase
MPMGLVRRAAAGATLALAFLTILPVRPRGDPAALGAAAAWFPAVGGLVGLIAGGAWVAAEPSLGAGPAGVLALVVLVVLTGALHQDGLADCVDALGVRGDRARRLDVMRDPSIGAFGAIALVLWALLFAAALGAMPREAAIRTLVLAAALGRWGAVLHGAFAAPARAEGLGAAFRVAPGAGVVATASVIGAALVLDPASGLAALGTVGLATFAVTAWARRAVGGRTGDTLGATVVVAELIACLVLIGFVRS